MALMSLSEKDAGELCLEMLRGHDECFDFKGPQNGRVTAGASRDWGLI